MLNPKYLNSTEFQFREGVREDVSLGDGRGRVARDSASLTWREHVNLGLYELEGQEGRLLVDVRTSGAGSAFGIFP